MNQTTALPGTQVHIAFVTDDIESATERLVALLGVPMPQIKSTPDPAISQPEFRGAPARSGCRQVNFTWGSVGIEVIEPNEEPSTWKEFLAERGPGIHHIGLVGNDSETTRAHVTGLGYESLQSGRFNGGEYEYFDTAASLGALVEVLHFDANDPRSKS